MSTDTYSCGHTYDYHGAEDRSFEVPCPKCHGKPPPTERSTRALIDRYQGYRSDPMSAQFQQLVDLMVCWMIDHKIPPDELRDAAYLASIKFVRMHPIDVVYRRDDLP